MSELFKKVKSFVDESFQYDQAQIRHFDRTVYWLQQLHPAADEVLLIAAYAHDIERAFRSPEDSHESSGKKFTDKDALEKHQKVGAQIIGDFLMKNGADNMVIEKVKHLISAHEVGGDEDQNILKDSDSLSFLENNAAIFIPRLKKLGYDKIKEKFDWMFNRISSSGAKRIAKPFYDKMIAELEEAEAAIT